MAQRRNYSFGDILNSKSKLTFLFETEPSTNKCGTKTRKGFFLCECGNVIESRINHVTQGKTISCKCHRKEETMKSLTTHSGSHKRSYSIWSSMITRCYDTNQTSYKYYGERGIEVCREWKCPVNGYLNFLKDMGEPDNDMTLDRKDNSKGYNVHNCRWSDYSNQAYNKRVRNTNTTGVTGVYFCKSSNKWRANIVKDKKTYSKRFDKFEDAVEYRRGLELKFYGYNLGDD